MDGMAADSSRESPQACSGAGLEMHVETISYVTKLKLLETRNRVLRHIWKLPNWLPVHPGALGDAFQAASQADS